MSGGRVYYSVLSAELRDNGEEAYYLLKPQEIEEVTKIFPDFYDFFGTYKFYNPHTKYSGLIIHYKDFPVYQNLSRIQQITSILLKSYEVNGNVKFSNSASNVIEFILDRMVDLENGI